MHQLLLLHAQHLVEAERVSLVRRAQIRQALVLVGAGGGKLGRVVRQLRDLHYGTVVAACDHDLAGLVPLHLRGRHEAPLLIRRYARLVLQRLLVLYCFVVRFARGRVQCVLPLPLGLGPRLLALALDVVASRVLAVVRAPLPHLERAAGL